MSAKRQGRRMKMKSMCVRRVHHPRTMEAVLPLVLMVVEWVYRCGRMLEIRESAGRRMDDWRPSSNEVRPCWDIAELLA
jgi:hypothetical protein